MKLEFLQQLSGGTTMPADDRWRVRGETKRLTDVVLSAPSHLVPVPCCAATIDSLAAGFETDVGIALDQHRQLRAVLEALGVRCHVMPPVPGLPDLCFTRDTMVTTPWGTVILNPAMPHRQREADHAEAFLRRLGIRPLQRIRAGSIEGGDVCVAREGLLIVGQSGERTTPAGVAALAALFEPHGWEVLVSRYDPRHLHLDTIFCMLDEQRALACIDALEPVFVDEVRARGIELLPVDCDEAHGLGCNIVSIDGRTILIGEDEVRLHAVLGAAGYTVVPLPISQFTACGGGVHCLTMPLARA
jgi:N-dimethylarginine dimethylaminohydrolase